VTVSDVANKLTPGTSGEINVTSGVALAIASGGLPDGVAGAVYDGHPCPFPGHSDAYCGGFSLQAAGSATPCGALRRHQPGAQ
jgi:hypothetical protein